MITPNSGPSQGGGVSHRESQRDKDEEDEEDEYGSGEDDGPLFPNSHTATLKQHKKVVSALSIDPSGARFASGAHDYDVKLWDFGGMGGGVGRAFKSFEPAENYYVRILFHLIALICRNISPPSFPLSPEVRLGTSPSRRPRLRREDGLKAVDSPMCLFLACGSKLA
jgi:WD40 repeat protein